jgi:hypothetical protein
VATIPAPSDGDSGLTWAEGTLWVGEYRARKIRQIDAETGAILRTIESDRFVTGVSWVNGELWHGTMARRRERNPPNQLRKRRCPRAASKCRAAPESAASRPTAPVFSTVAAPQLAKCARCAGLESNFSTLTSERKEILYYQSTTG